MKQKKQFRLYDIYRSVCTNYKSVIRGINSYETKQYNDKFISVKIVFNDGAEWFGYYSDEDELKELVTNVNKRLNNCRKPGKKKKTEESK